MVYYRKYRPQTIAQLDLVAVRNRLFSILQSDSIPHAFLFTGPKGLGKTSSARILAKAINCEKRVQGTVDRDRDKSIEPCNKCDACISITNGSNVDVLEIDAASNRGIDEIRDLRDKIKFAPASLPKKVYIIDEVHMLTTDAFNALLKTLEEPPSHAIFILCTTEHWKVPPTITSRAFHVAFEKPTKEEMISSFKRIVTGENLSVAKDVLEKVFFLSEGSFRDGAKIIEELHLTAQDEEITSETLEKTYKTESLDIRAKEFILALSEKNAKDALTLLGELVQKGVDFSVFNEKIVGLLHDSLLQKSGIPQDVVDISLDTNSLRKLIEYLSESYKELKHAVLPQLPLELAVVKWCFDEENTKPEIVNKKTEEKIPEAKIENKEKETGESVKDKAGFERKEEIETKTTDNSILIEEKSDKEFGELFDPNKKVENFFATLIERVKKDNHSIAGILRGCNLVDLGKDKVILEAKYKFHKDKLSEDKVRKILDKRASEILLHDVQVIVELKKQQ